MQPAVVAACETMAFQYGELIAMFRRHAARLATVRVEKVICVVATCAYTPELMILGISYKLIHS